MQQFPHEYVVTAHATVAGDVALTAYRLPTMSSAPPVEFDGPGDRWSPETLLVAAVGDCFVLTFRAVAGASRLPWTSLRCAVSGTLDRVDRTTQFVKFEIHAHLAVPAGIGAEQARRALEKAERSCLITNSLKAPVHLESTIDVAVSVDELTVA